MPYKLVPPKAGRWSHWRVRGTENGLYLDRTTKTAERREAQKRLNEWREEAKKSSGTSRKPVSFAEAATSYLDAGGEGRFLVPLARHFGNAAIATIGQSEIDAAAATLYPNATPATRNRQVYSPMSAILKRAGLPAAFRRPKGAQGTPRLVWLKPEEAMRLLDAAEAVDARFGALCTFLLYTGCRLSEALRLRWSDVNLEENFAYVRHTKTGTPRPVHLPEATLPQLRILPRDKEVVFGLRKSGRLYEMLGEALASAGIRRNARTAFHLFRHTFGALMRRYAGLDTTGLVATGAWKSRQAAAVYEHAVTTEEARKADLLPTRAKSVRDAGNA